MHPSEFSPLIESCCAEVLDSMYFASVSGVTHAEAHLPPCEGLAFSLHFTGDVHGVFGVSLGAPTARTLAANFLGEEEDALAPEEVSEVVGELTNMLCGSVVSRIEGSSKFVLTHPEPLASGPAPGRQPLVVSTLLTDIGPLQVWIALDAGTLAPEPAEQGHA